jgi:hypothetical protein
MYLKICKNDAALPCEPVMLDWTSDFATGIEMVGVELSIRLRPGSASSCHLKQSYFTM